MMENRKRKEKKVETENVLEMRNLKVKYLKLIPFFLSAHFD